MPLHVAIRPIPATGLDGLFRIHMLPESLEQAGLRLGDYCEIARDDEPLRVLGYGIAWRADDRMASRPSKKPVKISETLSSAFGLVEGDVVVVRPTTAKAWHADRVVLAEFAVDEDKFPEMNDGRWMGRVNSLLNTCEAIAPGMSFDATGKKKTQRKRFTIKNITSIENQRAEPALYYFDDRTQLVDSSDNTYPFTSPNVDSSLSASNGEQFATSDDNGDMQSLSFASTTPFPIDHIGGLVEQVKILQKDIADLLAAAQSHNRKHTIPNAPILLHGYEGTGKTMLLRAISKARFRSVHALNRGTLDGGSVSKNKSIIIDTFKKAEANQPALIIMDNIDEMVPSDDIAYATVLLEEFARIENTGVLVVGATRSTLRIKSSLISPEGFLSVLELSVPDLSARQQILRHLLLPVSPPDDENRITSNEESDDVPARIAARTHGFTGRDVAYLHKTALLTARRRSSALPITILPQDWDHALTQVRPTALREIFFEKPSTRWTDIGGSDHVRATFDRIIGWPQQYPEILAEYKSQPTRGVLLYGPPGCSKTLTAQAVANMYNLNFIAIKGAELVSMYVGESERAVREVFRKARAAAPCVIFFDEIDSIGSSREGSTASSSLNVLTTLLNEIDGFDRLNNVCVLAATNRPEILDPALLRPGRFDKHIYLAPPDAVARREILAIATRGIPLAPDVDLDALVRGTEGHSGAELVSIAQVARDPAMAREIERVQQRACEGSATGAGDEVAFERGVCAADFAFACAEVQRGITAEMLEGYEEFARRR